MTVGMTKSCRSH